MIENLLEKIEAFYTKAAIWTAYLFMAIILIIANISERYSARKAAKTTK
jgi:preprotein translocase subunit SecG